MGGRNALSDKPFICLITVVTEFSFKIEIVIKSGNAAAVKTRFKGWAGTDAWHPLGSGSDWSTPAIR